MFNFSPNSDQKLQQAKLLAAYKRLFTSPDGKEVLADLASKANFDRTSFDPTPGVTDFNEGRRSIVLEVFSNLNTSITEYLTESVVMEDI